ncbi:PEGA domain-containing protein [Candidatus Microgenomates bacterium]|nr:PEGA domain-containing protein [Candidatus Microgenomates bacterium]
MKKLFLFAVIILLIIGGALVIRSSLLQDQQKAGLQVTSDPQATIFLEGKHLGQTPYSDKELEPGELILKLVPESEIFFPWEQKIKLNPGTLTVVDRQFGEIEESSSGEILTLETLANKNLLSLAIISTPDEVIVKVDGTRRGSTPISLEDITEGDHLISLSLPGFVEKEIKAKTILGRKLIINSKLAKESIEAEETSPEAKKEAEEKEPEKEKELERPYVTIKETPTGWLRVREGPTTNDAELTKVKPGEKYKFLEATETGWYKIEYEEGKEGWISGKYATKYE